MQDPDLFQVLHIFSGRIQARIQCIFDHCELHYFILR